MKKEKQPFFSGDLVVYEDGQNIEEGPMKVAECVWERGTWIVKYGGTNYDFASSLRKWTKLDNALK